MSVTNGSPATDSVFNAAFVSRTQDTSTVGTLTLNNTSNVNSGAQVTNSQRAINETFDAVGMTGEGDSTRKIYSSNNVVANGDDRKVAVGKLDGKFDAATGHNHDGSAGSGGPIQGSSIAGVPLNGYMLQGTTLSGVTGTSVDVSTELTGKAVSTAANVLGLPVAAPYNKVILRDLNADQLVDGSGNTIYGRVTESASVWTLSFYVLIAATETAHNFGSSTDIDWYYQELFDPMVSTPVYSQATITPSDNATADVIDATTSLKGKVLLSSASVTSVGSANSEGTANSTVANANHVHQGLHAVQEFTEAVNAFGDIVLKAGIGVTIARTGNTFLFSGATSITNFKETFILSAGDITAQKVVLANTPLSGSVTFIAQGGVPLLEGASYDYSVSGNDVNFLNDIATGGVSALVASDVVQIKYQF